MLEEINETDGYTDLLLYQSELKIKRLENKLSKLKFAIENRLPVKPWTSLDKQFWSEIEEALYETV